MESVKKIIRTPSAFALIIVALFALIGVIIQSNTSKEIAKIPFSATQTAEASKILIADTPTATVTSMPTFTPEPTLTITASNTPTLAECKLNNLINRSTPIPVFVPPDSISTATFISDSLVVDFNNNPRNTSGVAFKFTSPLDVKGFNFLEISGTSTQTFTFLIEYKIHVGGNLKVVVTSTRQSFSATSTTLTVKIPIAYGGSIDELAINFFEKGEFSTFVIESLCLK